MIIIIYFDLYILGYVELKFLHALRKFTVAKGKLMNYTETESRWELFCSDSRRTTKLILLGISHRSSTGSFKAASCFKDFLKPQWEIWDVLQGVSSLEI